MKNKDIDAIARILIIVGALNWGMVGAFNIDLVDLVLGTSPVLVQLVYILIGLSGLYGLYQMNTSKKK